MAKIGLTEGFTLIPEGTHVFKITEVNYKEDFGKMEVVMQTAKGQKHIERFSLLNKDGEPNQGGLNAFSYFAKTALDDFTVKDIDDQELVGHLSMRKSRATKHRARCSNLQDWVTRKRLMDLMKRKLPRQHRSRASLHRLNLQSRKVRNLRHLILAVCLVK